MATTATLHARLLRWRRRLVPDELDLGWMPIFILGYLAFLFMPFVFSREAAGEGPWFELPGARIWPTLLSIALFLPLYFAAYRVSGARAVACMLAIAALGYLLLPVNPFSNTYVIFAVGFAAIHGGLWQKVGWLLAICGLFVAEIVLLGYPFFIAAITLIIAVAVFTANHFQGENARKRAELKLSYDEVRRLASLAERERIGRDLHDLLGHTLSLVALKSDLAGRLLQADPGSAQREINEVSRVAREALAQVRAAVTGIRAAGMAAELASARLLLECDGVALRYAYDDQSLDGGALPPRVETALALTVREAVTNIQRHARAHSAEIAFAAEAGEAVLRIADDGRGGAIVPGNGLGGMRERIEALGGRLRIDSGTGRGTRIEARLPLAANDDPGIAAHP